MTMNNLGRHNTVLDTMLAHGLLEPEARSLIEHAEASGRVDIVVVLCGRVVNFRLMPGDRCAVRVVEAARG